MSFTEKASAGARSEARALTFLLSKGYSLLEKNYWVSDWEADLLMRNAVGRLVVVEVRSRASEKYRPSRALSGKKIKKLERVGEMLAKRFREPVMVELCEVIGGGETPRIQVFRVF